MAGGYCCEHHPTLLSGFPTVYKVVPDDWVVVSRGAAQLRPLLPCGSQRGNGSKYRPPRWNNDRSKRHSFLTITRSIEHRLPTCRLLTGKKKGYCPSPRVCWWCSEQRCPAMYMDMRQKLFFPGTGRRKPGKGEERGGRSTDLNMSSHTAHDKQRTFSACVW